MDEGQLDRTIDAAAAEMMARESSRSLGRQVMARVRDDVRPSPRRFVWMTAAASMALCSAIAMVWMNLAPAIPVSLPPAAQLPIAAPPIAPWPIDASPSATMALQSPPVRRGRVAARLAIDAAMPVGLLSDDSPIAPIETEPIVLAAIDVPPLEREATSIEALNIEPLTIEPLTASND